MFALFFYVDLKKILFALFFYVDLKKIFEEEGLDLDPILSTKRTKLQMATDSKFADFGIIIGRIFNFPFQPYKACPNRTSIQEVMAPSISDTLLLISRLILNVKKKILHIQNLWTKPVNVRWHLLKLTTRGPYGRHHSENGSTNLPPERPLVKIFLVSD